MKRVRIPKIVWIALFSKVCFCQIWCYLCFHYFTLYVFFFFFFKTKKKPLQFLPPYVLFRFFKLILTSATCLNNVEIQDVRLCEMYNVTFTNYESETRNETFLNDL